MTPNAEKVGYQEALSKIAQYDPRWVGRRVNDAPSRSQLIAIAYDALYPAPSPRPQLWDGPVTDQPDPDPTYLERLAEIRDSLNLAYQLATALPSAHHLLLPLAETMHETDFLKAIHEAEADR